MPSAQPRADQRDDPGELTQPLRTALRPDRLDPTATPTRHRPESRFGRAASPRRSESSCLSAEWAHPAWQSLFLFGRRMSRKRKGDSALLRSWRGASDLAHRNLSDRSAATSGRLACDGERIEPRPPTQELLCLLRICRPLPRSIRQYLGPLGLIELQHPTRIAVVGQRPLRRQPRSRRLTGQFEPLSGSPITTPMVIRTMRIARIH
jgi:hypothetical protein